MFWIKPPPHPTPSKIFIAFLEINLAFAQSPFLRGLGWGRKGHWVKGTAALGNQMGGNQLLLWKKAYVPCLSPRFCLSGLDLGWVILLQNRKTQKSLNYCLRSYSESEGQSHIVSLNVGGRYWGFFTSPEASNRIQVPW